MTRYVIAGGRPGRERLALVSQVMFPTTQRLLQDLGLRAGMRCLDVGCGGGHVTLHLARQVGPAGHVVGIDMDTEILALARADAAHEQLANVQFRAGDAQTWSGAETYDLIYARFILTHLPDPARCMASMRQAARSGATIVVEDIDFSGSFCYPHCPPYERYTQLYQQVVQRRGGDANIGPKVSGMMRAAGLTGVQVNVIQPTHVAGDGKHLASITMQRVADAIVSEGLAGVAEVSAIIAGLDAAAEDADTVIGLPRIFQTWGVRA